MKRKVFTLFVLIYVCLLESFGQSSFLAGDGIAVFYPAGYDSSGNSSSLIFVNKLVNNGAVPSEWSIKPVFSIVNQKAVAKITYQGQVDLYGNGEVIGRLKRNGTNVTLWNTDNYTYKTDNGKRLYQSHPWVMGVRADGTAFGIIADNTWKQYFDLANPITMTSEGPAFRVVVIEKSNAGELMKTLAELTGKMELPPLWALGYQQCRFSYFPDTQVKGIADSFRAKKIPCDVIWMDIDYMQNYKVFTFDASGFSNPASLNDYLHGKDFKSVFMIDPGVKKQSGYFVYDQGTSGSHWVQKSDGQEFNGDVWPGACAFPDFTRPETRTWWKNLYGDYMATGIDGVWNDMNEPAVFGGTDGTMPTDNIHRGGGSLPQGSHLRYHNVYGRLMVQASVDGIKQANPDKRPFVLSRSNFLGGQRFAATWTGDNSSTLAHMKLSIPMSLTLGLSGQPFSGPDIGGFDGNCNADLLAKWMALGAYYPFSRNHSTKGSVSQEPWAFGTAVENVSRTAINRRYRLLPYLYTLFREASQTGMPIMRPVFFADYTNLNLRAEEQIFLLGNDLLITPRWAVNVNFPAGDWDNIKLEDTDDGYQATVMIRPGAIVPIGPVIQSTADYSTDSLTLLINPLADGSASGKLYHDDGDGFGYKTNDFAVHQFISSKHNDDSLKIVIEKTEGDKAVNNVYRIGYVTDNSIAYSPWSANTTQYVAIIEDKNGQINLPTSIDHLNIDIRGKVSIFPNPANDNITIATAANEMIKQVEFYHLDGSLIRSFTVLPSDYVYDISWLNEGMYFIRIRTEKNTHTYKLAKQ